MIVSSHGIIGSSIGQVDADYQAILDYATTQGYTLPSASQRLLQEQLVIDLKDAGIWDKLDTFAVFATDGNSNFALIDWKRLIQYSAINSPTFTTNLGFRGNATSSYISTNFIPSTNGVNYTLNDASRYFYSNFVNTDGNGFFDGILSAFLNNSRSTNTLFNRINQSGAMSFMIDLKGVGMRSIHRTSDTNTRVYISKSATSGTAISSSLTTEAQVLFATDNAFSDNGFAMYAMGASLTSENDNFVDAFNNYLTSI